MVWPIDDLTTAHLDAGTDDPKQARPELLANINKFKAVLGDPAITEVATIAAIKSLAIPSSAVAVNVQGYTSAGDGGGGLFWWDSASSTADNGGTVIIPNSSPANGRWMRLYSGALDAKWFGAKIDGTTDDSSALQSALDAATGLTLVIPPGSAYCPGTLVVPDNTTIYGYGARVYDTGTHRILFDLGSGVRIYGLEIEGAGNASANIAATLVRCQGTDNNPNAPTYINGPILSDCYLHGSGFYAVLLQYVNYAQITNCTIKNIGYAGVMGLSVSYSRVEGCNIIDISPGSTNAYGVAFTRMVDADSLDNLTPDPRSSYCTVCHCLIDGVPLWEGLDTHAGSYITFANNTIRNCRVGIACVTSHFGGTSDFGPQFCSVIGNLVDASNTHAAISLAGASSGAGTPKDSAKGCVINANVINKGGEAGSNISGSIIVHTTLNLMISGNTIYRPNENGIQIYHTNRGFIITGNTITDPHSASNTATAAIAIRSTHNQGSVTGNTVLRETPALNTHVCEVGFRISNATECDIYFDDHYNEAVSPLFGATSALKGRPAHQESGQAALTSSTSTSSVSQTVTFSRPFSIIPKVIVSHDVSYIGSKGVLVAAQSVSTTGFTIVILTPDNANFTSAVTVDVSWTAMQ